MKKTSFQIQAHVPYLGRNGKWIKVTRCIKDTETQMKCLKALVERDGRLGYYALLYRCRLRDGSWYYASENPGFNIIDGKFIIEEKK